MSDVMNADRYVAGIATAYGAAVQGGYTGTYAQFCAQQAQFAENAQAVEEAKQEVLSTVQTFENTTVPAAITQVQEEGTAQIQVVQDVTAQQITALQEEGLRQQAAVVEAAADQVEAARIQAQRSENAADAAEGYRDETQGLKNTFENTTVPAAVQTVQNAGAAQVQAVEQAGSDQVDAVELAGSTQVGNVNTAGMTQVGNVNQAGTTQVSAVAAEGAAQVQAVEDKGDEVIASIPSEYTQLSEDVDILKKNKAPVIVEEASGQLVSIVDGADGMLVKKLLVNVDPVQDLHGQDAPYPAGGGVNKFDESAVTFKKWTNSDGTVIDINYGCVGAKIPVNASNYYLKSFGGSPNTWSIVEYASDESFVKRTHDGGTYPISVTLDPTTAYIAVQVSCPIAKTMTAEELASFKVELVEGSTAPTSYSPYSNICPITGWTGCEANVDGTNLWDDSITPETIQAYSTIGASVTVNGRNLYLKPGTYTFSFTGNVPYSSYVYGNVCNSDGSWVSTFKLTTSTTQICTITLGQGQFAKLFVASGSPLALTSGNIQLEVGSSATPYKPFNGTTLSVTFPDTVFGGSHEFVSGGLKSKMASVDLGTLNWSYQNGCFDATVGSGKKESYSKGNAKAVCSQYIQKAKVFSLLANGEMAFGSGYVNSSTCSVIIKDTRYNDATSFKSAMSGVQLVYELATPIEIQLTPQTISTLKGVNNVWSDAGSVDVEYPADTKLFIEKLTQPTKDDMTANHAISAGTFFQLGNTLYLATAQIAAGATITPGTNATKLSLADALNQVNA